MGKIQNVSIAVVIIIMLILFSSFRRKKPQGIIGVDIEEDSVKIITFNLRYGVY